MVLAVKQAGFDLIAAERDAARLPPRLTEVDCYVQLPFDIPDADDALHCPDPSWPTP